MVSKSPPADTSHRRAFTGICHTLRSYVLKHDSYPRWLAEPPETTEWHRFCSRREAQAWVNGLPQQIG
jgi:hypothetical protein